MLENKNSDPFSVIIKAASDTPLHDILSTVYDADKLEAMLIRAIKYANNYGYVAGTEYTEDQVMRILSEMKQKKQTQN